MTILSLILAAIVIINSLFVLRFLTDLIQHKKELKAEPASNLLLAISSPIIFFLSSFGISDFSLSTLLYRATNQVSDKKLPGTLNTQCVIPVAVMAFAFISVIKVDTLTLITCIIAQILGAYIGPRFVVKLSSSVIRKFISAGLIIAALFIFSGQLHFLPGGGTAISLSGVKLGIAIICLFIFGALNNIGIGSFSLTMAVIYGLGMNPAVAFPIMMGACTFSVPIGSMQFIKYGEYSRKITLFAATLGVLGVLTGVYVVKELDVTLLQWLVAIILFYSGVSMLAKELNSKPSESGLTFINNPTGN